MGFFALLSIGCSVSAEDYSPNEEVGSTHIAVRVRHVTDPAGDAKGDALVGFVRAPARADISGVLTVSGLGLDVPPRGECFSEKQGLPDISTLTDAELLEVETVRLETEGGSQELAPYAFPTVADLLRGVVYLSRDQSAEALPAGASYTLLGEGIATGEESVDVVATRTSPPAISRVTGNGVELGGNLTLASSPVLDLRWDAGEPSDLIVATVENDDEFWACTFADSEGFGAVPLITDAGSELGAPGRAGIISVHRIRSTKEPGLDTRPDVSVTFDFALETQVSFEQGGPSSEP